MPNSITTPSSLLNVPAGPTGPAQQATRDPLPGEQVFDFTTNSWITPQPTAQPNPFGGGASLEGTMTTPSTPTTTPTTPPQSAGGGTATTQATDVQPAALPGSMVATATPTTTPTTMSQFASYLDTMKQKLKEQNDLATQRNLLYTALFNRPLTTEEIAQLSPAQQAALKNGDKNQAEMALRILNDTISGRTNTLNQSVSYLTDAYQKDLDRAEQAKKDAVSTITGLFEKYADDPAQAASILKGLYTPDQIAALKKQGIDVDALANQVGGVTNTGSPVGEYLGLPTFNTEATNPGVVRATRNNNPGNIKASATTIKYPGVIGVESKPAADGGYFLIFDSAQSGAQAQATLLLNGASYQGVSAEQAIRKYSGGGYGASAVGLDPNADFQSQIADPAKLQSVVTAIQQREGYKPLAGSSKTTGQSPLSDVALTITAVNYLKTGSLPTLGMGKDAASSKTAIINKASEIAEKYGAGDIAYNKAVTDANKGALKTMQQRQSTLQAAEQTATKNLDLALSLAKNVPDTGSPIVNRIVRNVANDYLGDPETQSFVNAILTAASEYAKVVSGAFSNQALTDSARNEAKERISTALTKGQLESVIATMKQEMENAKTSNQEQIDSLGDSLKNLGNSSNPTGIGSGSGDADYQNYLKAIGQ